MIFMEYWFGAFAAVFFLVFWLTPYATARRVALLLFCIAFHAHFAGPAGVFPIIVIGVVTFICGLSGSRTAHYAAISLNVAALLFYKYTLFLSHALIGSISTTWAEAADLYAKQSLLPAAPPLAISFFVFEFVHYLIDVSRGHEPIRSPLKFALFGLFWPSIVAGPIKRYEQFIPEMMGATLLRTRSEDVANGLLRISIGFIKKTIADNLTQAVIFWEPHFETLGLSGRWMFLVALAFRILLDFSGYSDIAIGFARMMGIRLPENFNWPYIATTPANFWRRWHMSLSNWIKDYVYIPLGGNRVSSLRRAANALIAFALCGLWHGAAWNFAIWGVYHGVGVAATSAFPKEWPIKHWSFIGATRAVGWVLTSLFVMIGWLLFFFPLSRALEMTVLLFSTS
jgi:alginate O-acetyltransferase complex protein AlgI